MFYFITLLLAGLIAGQAIDTDQVNITVSKGAGNGCPAADLQTSISSDKRVISLNINNYRLTTGADIPNNKRATNCQFAFKAQYPKGIYYSLIKTIIRGFAQVDSGTNLTIYTTYYPASPVADLTVGDKTQIFGGGVWAAGNNFELAHVVPDNAPFRSDCGTTDPLGTNFNTRIAFSQNATSNGLVTGAGGPLTFEIHLDYFRCKS